MKTVFHVAFASLLVLLSTAASAQTSLPDFTELAEKSSAAVVSIESTRTASSQRAGANEAIDPEDMPEFFRRFFGQPGMPPMEPRDQVSTGSGFIISGDGEVLTNHHVIDGADEVIVRLPDRREYVATVVGSDAQADIALLRIKAKGLPYLKAGSSKSLRPGQWVYAIGSPFGFLDNTVTVGVVSGVGRRSMDASQQYTPFIQTDVAINRGNSGGPLLNTDGEVVGINSQIFSNSGGYMGVSFAIPIEVAMDTAKQLRETGHVRRGQLGVAIQNVDRKFARTLGLDRSVGALISSVTPDSAAEKAGVKVGDVILSFNGIEILQSSDLPPMVGNTAPGSKVKLRLLREGKERELTAVLGEVPADDAVAGSGAGAGGKASTGVLGLVVQTPSAEEREQLGLEAKEGVLISRVVGDAARRAGLREGDVILRVGRTAVANAKAFSDAVAAAGDSEAVMLLVRRGDQTQFVAISPRKAD
ncbi:MAG: hypothetical protein CVV14_11065 [Gammaproteobacteria bacterium HGW-Gammaproteobacteria-4]|nr:MAG: hypothetical protein CVV14_11065 [Gammaproteobacteria bacterium HGW-Gammaproteobacteria-4]